MGIILEDEVFQKIEVLKRVALKLIFFIEKKSEGLRWFFEVEN